MANVTYKNVVKKFGDFTALHNLNIEIIDKEFLVLVGPSGCGKTTALRCLAGLEEITDGEVLIGDRVVNDVAPKDRDIAMVFQSYALYPHMSVYDNMAFGLKLRKMPKDEIKKRVDNAAEILGLKGYLDRKPKALSGGQRQRVALGRAIVRDAKVFLMDEPLSNLDAKLRVAMRAELIKLHERLGTTTIYVTHDQIEAMTMATRIVVMKDGRIQQIGAPKEIYDNPNNMFVGGFIGTPAMNFLPGVVKDDGVFYCETLKLKVDEKHIKILKDNNFLNKEVVLGFRPEDVHDEKRLLEQYSDAKETFIVDVAELLGAETNIHITVGEHNIIAKVNARADLGIGDKVDLAINMSKSHFFNPETEERLVK